MLLLELGHVDELEHGVWTVHYWVPRTNLLDDYRRYLAHVSIGGRIGRGRLPTREQPREAAHLAARVAGLGWGGGWGWAGWGRGGGWEGWGRGGGIGPVVPAVA